MNTPAPLLDFFRRGEVARDGRLLAAEGILAPRAHEQVAILLLLLDDPDSDVRQAAARTIESIPLDALRAYLGRSDVPAGVIDFFANRGVFPSGVPATTAEWPLVDPGPDTPEEEALPPEGPARVESVVQRVQRMGFTERLKAAMRGSREMRAVLIRDSNKMIAAAVLSSPKVSDAEVESFARMASVSEDVLRIIATSRAWLKNYPVVVALTRNPKTPLAISLNLLGRLNDRDTAALSIDRNVPDPLRASARRRVVFGTQR